jgi:prolyl-tRNA synthetase
MMSKWVQSYRDLPVLMNQWANVIRWELRTRPFLRTAEFLWQEGHTAHATAEEAEAETRKMLGVYREVMEKFIAMPVLTGLKTDSEKFAGAVRTYACEALVQDNRAVQAGTSHFLGQNFSKQFDLKFQSVEGKEEYAWNTSWGTSTRMIGAMVMTHGDDAGIVVPPRLAPTQVVVVPIVKGDDAKSVAIRHKADELCGMLATQQVRAKVDHREHLSFGAKCYEWERKGVPYRMEIGPKDLDQEQVALVRRVTQGEAKKKEFLPQAHAISLMPDRLEAFQRELLEGARKRREENSHRGVSDWGEMKEILETKGGFVYTGWSGDPAIEKRAKEELKATIRVIPDEEFRSKTAPSKCIGGSGSSRMEVVWARAY